MLLKDYFNQTVYLNDNKLGGWSKYYYGIMSDVIEKKGYKNIAEVGIGYGTHAKQLLKTTSLTHLFLVDPMVYYPNDAFANDINTQEAEIPGNNFNEMVDLIKNELSPWNKKYTWFRKPSLTITNDEIPDNSLDCVFIDGDHSYNAVLNDLRFWWNKIKAGGEIMGDDYYMTDVKNAVEQFSKDIKITVNFYVNPTERYKIFYFIKPKD